MNLTDYVQKEGGTGTVGCQVLARVAAAAGCSTGTLYMIAKGHKQAGPKLAQSIETATGGEVTRKDLRPDIYGLPEAA